MKKSAAFTLLEVVIVIIIIGVLASLALPRLFAVIEHSYATEAIGTISSIRAAMERCYLRNNGTYWVADLYKLCGMGASTNNLDIEDPSDAPGSHFNYYVGPNPDGYSYVAVAFRKNSDQYNGKIIAMGLGTKPTIIPLGGGPADTFYLTHGDPRGIYWNASDIYKSVIPK